MIKKEPSRLQDVIDSLNRQLYEQEESGYNKIVAHNMMSAIGIRDGLIDAYWDPKCYDKEEIKYEILEFTKIIIRFNNIKYKILNDIELPSVLEQLKDALKTDEALIKIFKNENI